jgi:hypothetical protein
MDETQTDQKYGPHRPCPERGDLALAEERADRNQRDREADSEQEPGTPDPGPVSETVATTPTVTPTKSAQGKSGGQTGSFGPKAASPADDRRWSEDVRHANRLVDQAQDQLEDAKIAQKLAKDAYDAAVLALRRTVSERDQPKLPFGEPGHEQDKAAAHDAADAEAIKRPKTPALVDVIDDPDTIDLLAIEDREWRALHIATLDLACQGHLEAAGLFYIGRLLDWQKSGNKLTDIVGVGEASAVFILSALEDSRKAWLAREGDETDDECATSPADARWLATEVATLAMPDQTAKLLIAQGFRTIGDIANWTARDKKLQDIKGVGDAKAKEIEDALEAKERED